MSKCTPYDVWYDDYKTNWNPFPSYKWFAGFCGETLITCREFDSEALAWDWIMDISIEL